MHSKDDEVYDRVRAQLNEAQNSEQKTRRYVQRRTRRSSSTIEGAAPETTIGRVDADQAGARPYRLLLRWNVSQTFTIIAIYPWFSLVS